MSRSSLPAPADLSREVAEISEGTGLAGQVSPILAVPNATHLRVHSGAVGLCRVMAVIPGNKLRVQRIEGPRQPLSVP